MNKWKNEEIELSKNLIQKGLNWQEIAEELERSKKSVRMKLSKLGYSTSKPQKIIEKECKNCNEKFTSPYSHKRKFCSSSCSASFNNLNVRRNYNPLNYIEKECKNCKNKIIGKKIFCSHSCQHEYYWNIKKEKIENGEINSRRSLKKYFLEKEGHKCKICENKEWNGQKIPLVLDHINGDSYNDLISNLRLICPNCDAQTEFYKGKNIGRGRKERMKRYYDGKTY